MIILQILLGLGSFGIIGFGIYWFAVVLKAGTKVEQDQINKDDRFK
jgi:F0F1-type ATP synthase assembly protein I